MNKQKIIDDLKMRFIIDLNNGTFKRRKAYGKHLIGSSATSINNSGYEYISVFGEMIEAHRLIWLLVHDCWPINQIDHIDRNKRNNSINNLREVTDSQNKQNRSKQKNNTSGCPGVYWSKHSNKWQAYITINKKRKHLQLFDCFEEAVAIRKAAERKYFIHATGDKHGMA